MANTDAKAAAEAVEVANAEAKYRTDLIAVLREIRDAILAQGHSGLRDAMLDRIAAGVIVASPADEPRNEEPTEQENAK